MSSIFSMLRFARASSPKKWDGDEKLTAQVARKDIPNRLRAYIFADKKSQSPDNAASGVRHAMFVDFMIWLR